MKLLRLIFLILPVYMVSCKPQQKLPYYLDNVTDSTGMGAVNVPELKIQKNDLLSIQIYSLSTKPEVSDAIYNHPEESGSPTGYLVDLSGNIQHHRLGVIHAEGLTKSELENEIKKRLTEPVELLVNPTVIIRFLNFKVTVLGQVGKEGPVTIPGEKLTIFEAIGLAGGINDFGQKNNVKIIREVDGKREFGIVDLSSDKIFDSPYYNLKQDDLIIIGETNQRLKDSEQAKILQKISVAFTLVTVAATLANIFIK
jgi:polysaccharide export outer membrane protein